MKTVDTYVYLMMTADIVVDVKIVDVHNVVQGGGARVVPRDAVQDGRLLGPFIQSVNENNSLNGRVSRGLLNIST